MPKPKDFTEEEAKKRDRLAKQLAKRGGVRNPFAVATAAIRKGKRHA